MIGTISAAKNLRPGDQALISVMNDFDTKVTVLEVEDTEFGIKLICDCITWTCPPNRYVILFNLISYG